MNLLHARSFTPFLFLQNLSPIQSESMLVDFRCSRIFVIESSGLADHSTDDEEVGRRNGLVLDVLFVASGPLEQ